MSHKQRTLLVEAAYAPATRRKYKEAVTEFKSWCRGRGIEDTADPIEFDSTLCEFLHSLYCDYYGSSGKGKQKAIDTVYGVIMYVPYLRDCLPKSKGITRLEQVTPLDFLPSVVKELGRSYCRTAGTQWLSQNGHRRLTGFRLQCLLFGFQCR